MTNPQEEVITEAETQDNVENHEEVPQEEQQETEQEAEADEGEGEPSEENTDIGVPPQKTETRGQSRHQRLANETKAEREKAERAVAEKARLEAELEFMKRQQREIEIQNQRRVDQERLANMSPEDRMAYEAQMRDNYWQNEIQALKFQMQDNQDRSVFAAKATIDENYAKYQDQVEKLHADYASKGLHYQREDILKHLIGDELLKNRRVLQNKKKEVAAKRVAAVSTKPTTAKSDGQIQRRGKSLEQILDGVEI